jgi:hypothetical protein
VPGLYNSLRAKVLAHVLPDVFPYSRCQSACYHTHIGALALAYAQCKLGPRSAGLLSKAATRASRARMRLPHSSTRRLVCSCVRRRRGGVTAIALRYPNALSTIECAGRWSAAAARTQIQRGGLREPPLVRTIRIRTSTEVQRLLSRNEATARQRCGRRAQMFEPHCVKIALHHCLTRP